MFCERIPETLYPCRYDGLTTTADKAPLLPSADATAAAMAPIVSLWSPETTNQHGREAFARAECATPAKFLYNDNEGSPLGQDEVPKLMSTDGISATYVSGLRAL